MDTCNKEEGVKEGVMDEKFNLFMETVDGRFRNFVNQINEYLTEKGCKCDKKKEKSGYVVSYVLSSKRTLATVDERFRSFVNQINEYLTANGCKCDIKLQKSGYVVSYVLNSSKRTLAAFVSRKSGMKLRIYPEHIQEYQSFLDTLPEKVKKEIRKASVCKRLINPDDCNPKCVMGYTFVLDGEQYQKCRYMAFQPTLSEENNPYIRQFLEKELQAG